jgi:hypothetical protein
LTQRRHPALERLKNPSGRKWSSGRRARKSAGTLLVSSYMTSHFDYLAKFGDECDQAPWNPEKHHAKT